MGSAVRRPGGPRRTWPIGFYEMFGREPAGGVINCVQMHGLPRSHFLASCGLGTLPFSQLSPNVSDVSKDVPGDMRRKP